MLAWMVYALVVALALSVAAVLTEHAATSRRMATRWPWAAAIIASLCLPIAIATVSIHVPRSLEPAASTAPIALRDKTTIPLAATVIDWSGARPYAASMPVNRVLVDIWCASSLTLVLFLGVSTALFHRRKRRWAAAMLCDVPVLVSATAGPAVVGLLRSRIVVPAWVLQETHAQQRYVMAHEQAHLRARDPLLVAVALMVLVAMPWNPFLWWQFHRLRCAIEVDCDARVLRAGGDVGEYCETLIHVGQNQSEFIGAVTAMSESQSFLERRIRIMLSKPQKWATAFAFALVSVGLGMAVFAALVTPPVAGQTAPGAIATDPALLDAYAGEYELSDYSLVTVARKGDGLTVSPIGQFMAQGTIDAPALSDTEFAIPGIDARIQFTRGPDHQVNAMVVYIHGALAAGANRVDDATAEQVRRDLAARVTDQKPFPEGERALRAILNDDVGPSVTSSFARARPSDPGSNKAYFDRLGPVESYRFEGVSDYGWDIYDVQHAHGAQQVFIQLDKKGLLVSSVMRRQ